MGLSFTTAAGSRQRSHSQVRVPRDSWSHFTVSDSRRPQAGWPGPRIYIRQEQDGPVISPGTGFPFRRFLRFAGLRWRYSTPPPHWIYHNHSRLRTPELCSLRADQVESIISNRSSIIAFVFVAAETSCHVLFYQPVRNSGWLLLLLNCNVLACFLCLNLAIDNFFQLSCHNINHNIVIL
jgi:hypothetical protein